jgi:phage gp16-like protein
MATDRVRMIAKIHVAKKQLALADDSYRDVVKRITGHDSARDCTDGQLEQLLGEFTRLGFSAVSTPKSGKSWVRKIHAIWRELQPLLDEATDATLAAFVARQTKSVRDPNGIARPEWLDAKQAKPVIHGLDGWLNRVKAEGKAKS